MKTNALPRYDSSDNPTGCCPRFDPQGWDDQDLHFENKRFLKVKTRSFLHIPLNMGRVFKATFEAIARAGAHGDDDFIVLSHDPSPWSSEHYFAVTKDVPGQESAALSGDYLTKVYEGPFKDAPKWQAAMAAHVGKRGQEVGKMYFFYTTCPKCAKVYGKNYVVAVAEARAAH